MQRVWFVVGHTRAALFLRIEGGMNDRALCKVGSVYQRSACVYIWLDSIKSNVYIMIFYEVCVG